MSKKRVIVWGTGSIGMAGLRGVLANPAYELVGLHAWGADKVGQDAGEIAGSGKVGVLATNNVAHLLALKADCLVYQGNSSRREEECVQEVIPFLEAGVNCVTPSLMDLHVPAHGRPRIVDPIRQACEKGKSAIFCGGTDPGWMSVGHTLSLLSGAGEIECLTFAEIADNSKYGGADSLRAYGFGMPLDHLPTMYTEDDGRGWHESTLRGIANYLGVELDEITSGWETAALDYDVEPAMGPIKAGTVSAIRWTMKGMYKGSPLIVYKKVERVHPKAAPDWELPLHGAEVGYRIGIKGNPSFDTEMTMGLYDGCLFTALHPINAIEVVCAAEPGVYGQLDLGYFYSKNIVR